MKLTFLILLILTSLLPITHAEGNCPPGYFPTTPTGSQGPQGCAPIPNYDQDTERQAGPRWLSRWGAIATSSTHGVLGASTGMPSQRKAEKEAVSDCKKNGGLNCNVAVSYANGCGALVAGDTGYNTTYGATEKEAIQSGMQACSADGDPGCRVYYSTCSPPVQVQ